ncbi:HEXXH motif-containing protein [Streptomyces sp. V3I8]|uniref:aKG-HExxH-type peptide beta-hydroxylase n=1 Tax=Streptomyces sp. V3I8 TaxID=3042279 RepID=UPI0027871C26|nr:HEXXH motif-containing putative peptide modification protein [Streptomyces sp. V3I8]MDQ1036183.1 HEXXH motif-containing protein [Streptomyces sp. V3I8]
MIPSVLTERALSELGRTAGGPDTLALLQRDQYLRRLLLLRAVLDAVDAADPQVCPRPLRDRLREDWALLEEADGEVGAEGPTHDERAIVRRSSAHTRLLYPLVGPWGRTCLRALGSVPGSRAARRQQADTVRRGLAHFSALAAAAAVRAGVPFSVRLTATEGALHLPSLGALRMAEPGGRAVDVVHRDGRTVLSRHGCADVVVYEEAGTCVVPGVSAATHSGADSWVPAYSLPGLLPGSASVPLDDLDPYRSVPSGQHHQGLSGPATLDGAGREQWLRSWSGVLPLLRLGGEHRVAEVAALLRCLVPLAVPAGPGEHSRAGSCSGTRREAFGAVLSSMPPTPATFAATLVHEVQHAKLAALSDMVVLHREGPQERYFAPWRPDPRPYDGLLQGVYSHVALADFYQRCALTVASRPGQREAAWREHARYREQVRVTLPVIAGADSLTSSGRRLVDQLAGECERMGENPPPRGARIRAEAAVNTARALWLRSRAPSE